VVALLSTKFFFPPIPAGFVARPKLLEKLDETLTHRLTLVSAPAGAGKTTLVSSWVRSAHKQDMAFGWLSLDAADNDPGRFLEYLGACLEEGGTIIDIAASPAEQADKFLTEFIRGLMDLEREVILILDDYHLIENKQIHSALQFFLDRAPAHLHLILLTRSDAPLELARLRVAGQLVELRMDDLRFSAQEAGEFLEQSAGVKITEEDVNSLNSRAEGWVAGLQMAAISLRGAKDPSAFIAAFAGSHRYVFDYLIEQVLDRQTPEVREFLLRTSILERLCAPLCDAVAGTGGTAQGMLSTIERTNLFLVPLDDEHGWYRYHHLFADLLKLVLEQTHPGLSTELHHLASHWYEKQGLLPEALKHALVAGDMELVAKIVSENVLSLVDHAELAPILAQFEAIPEEQRSFLPWLEIAYAWGLAYTGQNQRAAKSLSMAEQHLEGLAGGKQEKLESHLAAIRAYITWADGEHSRSISFAEQADRLLPANEIAVRSLNLTTLGNSLIQIPNCPRAVEVLEQALQLARQVENMHVYMLAASGLAYAYLVSGRIRRGMEICEQAMEIAEEYQHRYASPLTAAAAVYPIMARLLLDTGEWEKALILSQKAMAISNLWGQTDTVMISYSTYAYALALTNQVDRAREILRNAREIAKKASPWHWSNVEWAYLEVYLDSDPKDPSEIQQEVMQAQERGFTLHTISSMRVLLKQHRLTEVQPLLESTMARVGAIPTYNDVRLLALKALADHLQGDQAAALRSLKRALALAEPENRVISFVREGAEMEKLIRLAQSRSIAPAFTSRLLAAFAACRGYKPGPVPASEALIEPLSERELEVLQHLNSYLSTPEIADRLVVSANTVRTHIKSIYGKLGVHGRSGAVRRATELGLLA
jgi:LuxR family maltose regulon positive regulatory protein